MGCFTSPCPKCNKHHHWFIEVYETPCSCGYWISEEEMREQWDKYYQQHLDNNKTEEETK